MSEEAQSLFLEEMNGIPAHAVSSCCEQQYLFRSRCGCRRHWILCTAKTVKDNPKVLNCRQCRHAAGLAVGRKVSRYEAQAWRDFYTVCAGPLVVEAYLVGSKPGAADMWWPCEEAAGLRTNLVIAVDGEGHSTKPMHGKSIAQQQADDCAFDEECMAAGHNLLRLDYRDIHDWQDLMHAASAACREEAQQQPFAMYSVHCHQIASSEMRHSGIDAFGQYIPLWKKSLGQLLLQLFVTMILSMITCMTDAQIASSVVVMYAEHVQLRNFRGDLPETHAVSPAALTMHCNSHGVSMT